ncbi:MAG: CHAT domain-containing protein [Pseudonocardiaceae bacterium]
MTRGDSGDPPTIEEVVVALRARLVAAPRDIELHVELANALIELLEADEQRTPMAADADEPIELLRTAAGLAVGQRPELRAAVLVDLGLVLAWRFTALREDDAAAEDQLRHEADEAIGCLRLAFESAEEAGAAADFIGAELEALLRLVDLLRLRFDVGGELDDLRAAIDYEQRILGVLAADDEDRPQVLYRLGVNYVDRFDHQTGGAGEDRDEAIACFRELRELIGDDHPERPELAVRLGMILGHRVLASEEESPEEDFAEAVDELARARAALTAEEDAAACQLVRFRLGMVRAVRFLRQGGAAADRDVVIAELNELANEPEITTEQADFSHLILAFLELLRNSSVELPSISEMADIDWPVRLRDIMNSSLNLGDGDTVRLLTHHLDAISKSSAADPQFSSIMAPFQAMTTMLARPDNMSIAEWDEMLTWVEHMFGELGQLGMPDDMVTTIRAGVHAGYAYKKGDRLGAASATDEVIDAAAALDAGDPLREIAHNLLGALAGTLDLAPKSAAESSLAIARIERILAELPDDHPDRARALTKAGASLLFGRTVDRSSVSFDRVRELLTQTIERTAVDQENDSVNHFLLGLLNGIQGFFEQDIDLLDSGIELLKKAFKLAPEAHPIRGVIAPNLAAILYSRALLGGELENFDAAEFFSSYGGSIPSGEIGKQVGRSGRMNALGDSMAAVVKLARNRYNLDTALLDEVAEKLTAANRQLADDDPIRQMLSSTVSGVHMMRGGLELSEGGLTTAGTQAFQADVDAFVAASQQSPEGRFDHVMDTVQAAMAQAGQGFLVRDRRSLDQGISALGRICAKPDLSLYEQLSALGCLSMSLRMRYQHFRRHHDLSNAINRLEQAQALIAQSPPDGADAAPLFLLLGDCYHTRADPNLRDRQRAVEAGVRALRERAIDVLLQSNSERAVNIALAATGEAADVASWCLAGGRGPAAVEALELGRAIVLHFVTIDASIPALLAEGGHPDLAAEWAAQADRTDYGAQLPWNLGDEPEDQDQRAQAAAKMMADLSTAPVPSNLRRRVLRAVEGTDAHARLLSPPPVADIADALRATESSALVYLLPNEEERAGIAVIVYPDGTVTHRKLAGLRCGRGTVFGTFLQAQRDLHATPSEFREASPSPEESGTEEAGTEEPSLEESRQWQSRLNEICDWAWTAAMDEVLSAIDRPARGRVPRLVLVPVGELGTVPWHAACRTVPEGGPRYACQDMVISYASSARQFIDTSRRPKPPWHSAPAVVRVGGDQLREKLFWASRETEELRRCFYPHGTYLGAPMGKGKRAKVEQVLRLLPSRNSAGASVLHLGCHAVLEDPPLNSHLVLTDGRLRVRDMLEQARGRPVDATGGLVILAACASDLTGSAHDEALTLTTAFLAAGSIGVVGARWAVGDVPTALFMVMFHHYLNRGYDDPATALRAAQRWMLDKRRRLPEGVSHLFADELALLDLTETGNWAAFTYQGQ